MYVTVIVREKDAVSMKVDYMGKARVKKSKEN